MDREQIAQRLVSLLFEITEFKKLSGWPKEGTAKQFEIYVEESKRGEWSHQTLLDAYEGVWRNYGEPTLPCKWVRNSEEEDVRVVAKVMGGAEADTRAGLPGIGWKFDRLARNGGVVVDSVVLERLERWVEYNGAPGGAVTWFVQIAAVANTGKLDRHEVENKSKARLEDRRQDARRLLDKVDGLRNDLGLDGTGEPKDLMAEVSEWVYETEPLFLGLLRQKILDLEKEASEINQVFSRLLDPGADADREIDAPERTRRALTGLSWLLYRVVVDSHDGVAQEINGLLSEMKLGLSITKGKLDGWKAEFGMTINPL